jgi:hypothetical protein
MNLTADTDLLHPSDPDTISLAMAVQMRYHDLLEAYLRIRGVTLTCPGHLKDDARRLSLMMERWNLGNFQNTRSELLSMRAFAQWTHDVNCEIRNQKKTMIEWKD